MATRKEVKQTKNQKPTREQMETYLAVITSCENKMETLNNNTSKDKLEVQIKFKELREVQYKERADVIAKIPNFWFTVFRNHRVLSSFLNKADSYCLRHLTKLEVIEDVKEPGYVIRFHFQENPFFEDAILSKEYRMVRTDEFTSSTFPIHWKRGKDLTKMTILADQESGEMVRLDENSFFRWFGKCSNPYSDYIARFIKEELWCNPLKYFLDEGSSESSQEGRHQESSGIEEASGMADTSVQEPRDYKFSMLKSRENESSKDETSEVESSE